MRITTREFCSQPTSIKRNDKFLEHRSIRFIFLCWLNYAVCLLSSEDFACDFWEDPHWPIFERLLKPATRRFSGSTVSAVLAHKCQKGIPFALPGAPPRQPEFCDWAFNLPRGEALAKALSNGVGGVVGRPGFTFWQPWKMLKFIHLCVISNVFLMEITKLGQYPTWDSQGKGHLQQICL